MSTKKSSTNKPQKRKSPYDTLADYLVRDEISMNDICESLVYQNYIISAVNDDPNDYEAITLNNFEALQQDIAEYNAGVGSHEIIVKHKVLLQYEKTDLFKRRPTADIYFELHCNRQDTVPMGEVLLVLGIMAKYSDSTDPIDKIVDQYVDNLIRDFNDTNSARNAHTKKQLQNKKSKSSK